MPFDFEQLLEAQRHLGVEKLAGPAGTGAGSVSSEPVALLL
jgi:hypothetical protein